MGGGQAGDGGGEVGDGGRRSWGLGEELMMEGGEIENEESKFSSV